MDAVGYAIGKKVYDKLIAAPAYKGTAATTPYVSDGYGLAFTMSDNLIYWFGNRVAAAPTVQVGQFHAYDPATDTWTAKASVGSVGSDAPFREVMAFANEAATTIDVVGKGGYSGSMGWRRYTPSSNTWAVVNSSITHSKKFPFAFRRPGTNEIYVKEDYEDGLGLFDATSGTMTSKAYVSNARFGVGNSMWKNGLFWTSTDSVGVGKGWTPYDPTTNTYGSQFLTQSSGNRMGVGVSDGVSMHNFGHNNNSTLYGYYYKVTPTSYSEPFGTNNADAVPDRIRGVATWDPLVPGRIRWIGPTLSSNGTSEHHIIDTQDVPDSDARTLLGWLATR